MDHYEIVCERLFALKSWTYEEKSRLLQMIVDWTSQFEKLMPKQFDKNMRHLRELLTHNTVIKPMLPVETILAVIQSAHIPSEAWLDCILAAVPSGSSNNDQNPISFDFTPVVIPAAAMTVDLTSSTLFNSTASTQQSQFNNRNNRFFFPCKYSAN
jgi:hypothetical protein